MPTRLEVFTHELTHCPPEPWCEFCTMGKAKDKRHRTRTLEEIEQDWPEVQMDFMFVDASIAVCAWAERWTTILTAWDGDTGAPFALVVTSKSPDEYQVRSVCKWLDGLMHSNIKLKTDGEPSIKLLATKVQTARLPKRTNVQVTPRYSSASLGGIGNAQKLVQGQIRTLRVEVETKYGIEIGPQFNIFPWLVRHCY